MHYVYGSFDKRTQECGRHRDIRRPQLAEAVLNLTEEQPTTSTKEIAFQLNVDHNDGISNFKKTTLIHSPSATSTGTVTARLSQPS
nr:unnamed protein product [Callosobruchus chinensis]